MSDANVNPSVSVTEENLGPLSFSLEVRGAQTGYRRRPILGDRFLIGSDPVCDLRLDRRLGAPLHCLIRRDGAHLEAEPLTDVAMTHNGVPTTYAVLKEGDTLGIGQVRLIVHAHSVRFDVVRPTDVLLGPHIAATSGNFESEVGERSASDLVDLIELEEERVQDFDARRQAGMAALLAALKRTRRPAPDAMAEETANSLDHLVSQLDRLSLRLTEVAQSRTANKEEAPDADVINLNQWRLMKEIQRLREIAAKVVDRTRQRPAAG